MTIRGRRTGCGQAGVSLIELLVGMAIMGVISTMLLLTWFALSNSYSYSINSANARDDGRQALARLQREIRDAQMPTIASGTASDAILYRARPYTVALYTTFNEPLNSTATWTLNGTTYTASSSTPHLVVYRLYGNRQLWRFEDRSSPLNRQIDMSNGGTFGMGGSTPPEFPLNETLYGEGATLLVGNVDNWKVANPGTSTPVFGYNVYGSNPVTGAVELVTQDYLYNADRYTAVAVQIRLLVDLNPARAPVHADLRATAQLRNSR